MYWILSELATRWLRRLVDPNDLCMWVPHNSIFSEIGPGKFSLHLYSTNNLFFFIDQNWNIITSSDSRIILHNDGIVAIWYILWLLIENERLIKF